MAITNGYIDLPEAREQVGITDASDETDDSYLEDVVETVSRAIDRVTGTRFYTTASDETRVYTADDAEVFKCPNHIISITTLKTDEDQSYSYAYTWTAATDYWKEPVNAALDSKPYTQLRRHPTGNYSFPVGLVKGVQIIGKFGWYVGSAIEPDAKWVCKMLTQRIFKRREAPFGIAGTTDLGEIVMILRRDPDIMAMLSPFMRGLGVGV